MRARQAFAPVLLLLAALPVVAQTVPSLTGLWDLTITSPTEVYPSWLDISENGGQPRVRIVGRASSVHPADQAFLEGGRLTFMSKEYFGQPRLVIWEVQEKNGRLVGTQRRQGGETSLIEGERAPALDRASPTGWSQPEPLFNGAGLLNQEPGADIQTTRQFNDFKLHLEYNCPAGGASGVYLRGRYKLQIEYEAPGKNDFWHSMGSIDGFLAPTLSLPPRPGKWESFDITLVGRIITAYRNGKLIHNQEVIPGITGGALDSHESQPGPIYIQGDHTGGVKYRNLSIAVPEP